MKCPVCHTVDLTMTDRQGIEIDYCPQCRGVWLDRGELDKIIERSMTVAYFDDRDDDDDRRYRDRDRYYQSGPHKHKRKSFLGEMFDFD
jgi:Zn-finger nucleic acid-binding protein